MTAYVYTPYCAIPAPIAGHPAGSGGNYSATCWGAGIRAGTYPIRIIRVENLQSASSVPMWRIDGTTAFRNSTLSTNLPIVPVALRQDAPPPTCTTGLSTMTLTYSTSTSAYSISTSGLVPTGTFRYLGSVGGAQFGSSTTLSSVVSAGTYQFASELIVNPGSIFWIGSSYVPIPINGGAGATADSNGRASLVDAQNNAGVIQVFPSNIYFEEVQEDWTT